MDSGTPRLARLGADKPILAQANRRRGRGAAGRSNGQAPTGPSASLDVASFLKPCLALFKPGLLEDVA